MVSALFTALAWIAAGQVEPSAVEGNVAARLRSESTATDSIARLEALLRSDEPDSHEP